MASVPVGGLTAVVVELAVVGHSGTVIVSDGCIESHCEWYYAECDVDGCGMCAAAHERLDGCVHV